MATFEAKADPRVVEAMWRFLRVINTGDRLPACMGRIEDRARQKACKLGYARYIRKGPDRGWRITDNGKIALADLGG